jgi:hypothetical protein
MGKSNYQKETTQSKIIRLIIYLVVIALIGFFGYNFITNGISSNEEGLNKMETMLDIVILLCILAIPVLIIIAKQKKKSYVNKLVKTKPKQRFTYLDTFYYTRMVDNGDTMVNKFFTYHVLKDKKSNKIYAIPGDSYNTNAMFQYIDGEASLLVGKGIRFLKSSEWKEVPFDSEGSLWIKEEVNDYLTFNGDKMIFNNMEEKHVLKKQKELSNCNPKYDISLLKKATFVVGYAEFDMNK